MACAPFQMHHSTVDGDQGAIRRALEDNSNINLDTQSRFGYSLAVHLAEMYNFTYEMLVTPTWGFSVQADGSFDGMLGMLQRGEADFSITPAILTLPRLNAVDYTVQTWQFRWAQGGTKWHLYTANPSVDQVPRGASLW
ncbi:uncharacterized protein LOC117638989 [Thrips palmi]|uniref:Uncharacterized protein LOC117638989 n=1 Tax=Thrips palmi TaxID=161013 RepID=A0A6P8Y8U4_THRPL|nr:uncharacterized protein LOC117638989 [Thrips palmi]